MKRASLSVFLILPLLFLILSNPGPPGADAAEPPPPAAAGKVLRAGAMSAGGMPATSRNFRSDGTLGQSTPIGTAQSGDRTLFAGFWYGKLRFLDPSGTDDPPRLVDRLLGNHPNPFNPLTVIRFVAAQPGPAVIEIHDLRGIRIRTLLRESVPAGNHAVPWDGTDDAGRTVASGTYFYRLRIGEFEASHKMLLLK